MDPMFIATLFTIANYRSILELSPKKKDVLLIIGAWNAKAGSQEIGGVTGKG